MGAPRPERREWLLLLALSGIQFSQIVDFMVLMPLGTQLMRDFGITPTQLGFFVSIYTVSASLSGFFSALVIDRFDRRSAMLALYACFAATMAWCALAPGYAALLAARTAAGAFGGVVAANIFTIVADLVPEGRRGREAGASGASDDTRSGGGASSCSKPGSARSMPRRGASRACTTKARVSPLPSTSRAARGAGSPRPRRGT